MVYISVIKDVKYVIKKQLDGNQVAFTNKGWDLENL